MTGADPLKGRSPSIIYFINTYDPGGAELGLLKLIEGGMFEACDLTVVALIKGSGSVLQRLRELGCKARYILDKTRMQMGDLPVAYFAFSRIVREVSPQIVIGSLPQANILARCATWFRRDITYVSFEHNIRLAKPAYEKFYRITSSRVDWIFADAATTLEIVKERLYRTVPEANNHFVVPLIEFRSLARPRPPERAPNDPWRVVNAARLTDTKNQGQIIKAVAQLCAEGHAVELTLYGEGAKRATYEKLVSTLNLAESVSMPGHVGTWASEPADAFVLSSNHEGLCIVLLEAMHAGIPVAAPVVGGIRDYGHAGVMSVLPEVTPETIAAALADIFAHPEKATARVAEAAAMVDARYGAEAVRERYREIARRFREVLLSAA